MSGVDGTGPPTGSCILSTARSPLDRGRHACGSRVKYGQEQDRCYTAAAQYFIRAGGQSPLSGETGIREAALGKVTWPW